ncbi:MAG: hypothetical protein WA324_29305 [Bryobacteraceae bacterium]
MQSRREIDALIASLSCPALQTTAEERMRLSTGNATLYAFDAETGKELFSSGKTMSSFTHLGGIALSDGCIYATTHESTLYAFGLPDQ